MWKDIPNYTMYKINESGQIRRNGRTLKHHTDTNGYLSVMLCKDGKTKRFRVHRLVAEMFVENPENKLMVNHKSGIRSECGSYNLEWVTCSENHKHAYEHLHKKPPRPMEGKFGKDHNRSLGFTLRMTNGELKKFGSGLEAARELGIDHTSISYARKHNTLPYTFKRGKLKGITIVHFELA